MNSHWVVRGLIALSAVVLLHLLSVSWSDNAPADEWVKGQIERDVAHYQMNYRKTRNSIKPQILVGSAIGFGSLSGVEDLFRLPGTEFGLKRAFL